jgi:oligopeptide transport system substrate-binding protein
MFQTFRRLVLVTASLLLVAPAAAEKAELVYATRGPITVLDPNQMSWMQDIQVGQEIFEGIYRLDPTTPDLKPRLGAASDVQVSEDGLTWDITIRDNAKWSNGEDVLASDFAFAWQRNLREWRDYSYLIAQYIEGADDYYKAYTKDPKSADFSKVGIEVLGDKKLRVTLRYPITFFKDLLAFTVYWPQDESAMEPFKQPLDNGAVTYDTKWTNAGNISTNGPYTLAEWQPGVDLTMAMSEHYWDRDNVKSRTIQAVTNSNAGLALEQYEDGQIDWLTDSEPDLVRSLLAQGRGGKDVFVFPGYGTYFYTFNCLPTLPDGSENPFADVRVRQALTMVLDKKPIVETVTRLGEPVTENYVPFVDPPFFPEYEAPFGLPFDVAAAKELLAKAGYPDGEGFPAGITLLYDTNVKTHGDIAQIIVKQWQDKLGLNIELEPIENAQFKQRLGSQQYAVARASWYGDYMDISTFTDKYLSTADNNDAKWVNEEYDALAAQALRTKDLAERYELLSRAEEILLREAPILPLYHYVNYFLHKPEVKGIPQNGRKMVSMMNISTPRSSGPGMEK